MSKKPKFTPVPKVGGTIAIGHVKGSVPKMENPPPPPPKTKTDTGE